MEKRSAEKETEGRDDSRQEQALLEGRIVGIMGTNPELGRKTVTLNVATSLAQRNFKVLFSASLNDKIGIDLMPGEKTDLDMGRQIHVMDTAVQGLKFLNFSEESAKMSVNKMEDMVVNLPATIRENFHFFVYSVNDPYAFPDRYILLNTDIFIMVVRPEASVFSNVFLQLEKLSFIPKPPREIGLIFNKTKDLSMAYDVYRKIVDEAKQLNINVFFSFMGSVPNDTSRQTFAEMAKQPSAFLFPDSSFSSSISLIASKIIGY